MTPTADAPRCIGLMDLPLELRNHIYTYLLLPLRTITTSEYDDKYAASRRGTRGPCYIDSRLYFPFFPARLPALQPKPVKIDPELDYCWLDHATSLELIPIPHRRHFCPPADIPMAPLLALLSLNRQTRLELFDHLSYLLDISVKDTVKIQLDVLLPNFNNFGSYIPTRTRISPTFDAFGTVMSQLKRVRIDVLPGWGWWVGERRAPRPANEQMGAPDPADSGSDSASKSVGMVLARMENLEHLELYAWMRMWDYWNWDLPTPRHGGVQPFIDWVPNHPKLKHFTRKFMVDDAVNRYGAVWPSDIVDGTADPTKLQTQGIAFYSRTENWLDTKNEEGKTLVDVVEKIAVSLEENEHLPKDVEYTTREWQRADGA